MTGSSGDRPRWGVVLPQREIGTDPAGVRLYLTAVESLGYRHLLAYEHVVGSSPAPGREPGAYDVGADYHEPLVLFGFAAAVCELELVTGVLVLPQRQTALVAKQVAEVAVLARGRVRLGVGVGWNKVEYDALGADFGRRGRELDRQIGLLRELWAKPLVDLGTGTPVGISPRPTTSVPVWVGGSSQAAYDRIGRSADGWFPQPQPGPELDAALTAVRRAAVDAGRDPDAIGMEGRVRLADLGSTAAVADAVRRWGDVGATHVSVDTMDAGLLALEHHLDALADIAARAA